MPKKVSLNVLVNPEIREFVKITAIKERITMEALLERIIIEWGKSHS